MRRHAQSHPGILLAGLVVLAFLAGCGEGEGGFELISISISPENPSIEMGTNRQFTATGTFSDGTTLDITTSVSWASTKTTTATISNKLGSEGLATSVAAGSTAITATDPTTELSGSTTLTVKAVTLVSISVTPTDPSIARGLTQQFTATGTFSDGTTEDITTSVTWSSSNKLAATISNAASSKGLATSALFGTTTITATDPTTELSGSTTLTVTAATLVSIAVTPANPSVAKGSTKQFTATGTYTDKTTLNITKFVFWSSSKWWVAKMSNAGGSQGLATALAVGSTTITARTMGKSGSTTLKVE